MPASFVALLEGVINSREGGGGVGVFDCLEGLSPNLPRRAAPRSDCIDFAPARARPAIFFGARDLPDCADC